MNTDQTKLPDNTNSQTDKKKSAYSSGTQDSGQIVSYLLSTNNVDINYYNEMPAFPDFLALEREVRKFWVKNNITQQYLVVNNRQTNQFSFYDGPITANNPMGVHHAWGRTLKDVYLRYNTLHGKKARFQNGFDCQGLWVEVEVEKALKLNSKKEILDYGLEKFKQACSERVRKYGEIISDQSQVLGQFMDWNNSYWTYSDNNIEHIWYFLAECHKREWLYKGEKVMPWCPRCGTSLSQHEQSDSYQDLTHPSVYVQFEVKQFSSALHNLLSKYNLKSKPEFAFIVWTTTPWTLPANSAVAVHPELSYVFLKPNVSEQAETILIVGEQAYNNLVWLQESYTIIFNVLGDKLVKTQLESLCKSFVPKQSTVTVTVIPWFEVSEVEGTGLVHIAPGCGSEDYELGKKFGLKVLAPLDESGHYVHDFGFDGLRYNTVSVYVQEKLQKLRKILYVDSITHRYPICWRCGEELAYRLVEEWFLSTEEIRPLMLKAADTVVWSPPSMKARMKDWLRNMGDWCISRKRYWGLPLPFFECPNCTHLQVFSRFEDFYTAAGFKTKEEFRQQVPDMHRPYLDDLTVPCTECGNTISRITDVGDCWLDAGIVPFSTLNYLADHSKDSFWDQWFPADFVVEMREQVRLWFYSLLFMSVTLTGKAPYKFVLSHEKVLDEEGKAMHRSTGNAIWFQEAAEKLGVDQNRWFYAGWDVAKPLLFGFNNVPASVKKLHTFWSCCRFLQQNLLLSPYLTKYIRWPLHEVLITDPLDAWLISTLFDLENEVHKYYDRFNVQTVIATVSLFWDRVSTWWLRNNRSRFWELDLDKTDLKVKAVPYQLLWYAVFNSLKWFAPIIPHVTEYLYQILVRPVFEDYPRSLHLLQDKRTKYPVIAPSLQTAVSFAPEISKVVELVRQARQDAKIKNRYQLPRVWLLESSNNPVYQLWEQVLKKELNVQEVLFITPSETSNLVYGSDGSWEYWLEVKVTNDQKLSWYRADILRTVQFLRKQAKLPITQQVTLSIESTETNYISDLLNPQFQEKLKKEAFVSIRNTSSTDKKSWLSQHVKGLLPRVTVYLNPRF